MEMKCNRQYFNEENIFYYQTSQVALLPKNRNTTVSLDGCEFLFLQYPYMFDFLFSTILEGLIEPVKDSLIR